MSHVPPPPPPPLLYSKEEMSHLYACSPPAFSYNAYFNEKDYHQFFASQTTSLLGCARKDLHKPSS
ncbi:unnamed protein product [Prunus armeniaca]|uniref:Uncharacterized protein n=1 Tax=Prunus armeniaca TaxID=36596 RepID=A0A6J5VET5_PRUAR|nr:unnamed protein product [Prunus armeniaca]